MPRKEAHQAAQSIARECLATRIRRLDRSLSRIYDAALRPHGVTIAQLGLLTAVTLAGPVRPTKLGGILDLERSTVSRNLALLLRKGWVSASRAQDGRGQLVVVTRRGEALLRATVPSWRRTQRAVEKQLTPKGVLAFRRLTGAFQRE
jgi:DNA-binding MarR family transcriptional regulator